MRLTGFEAIEFAERHNLPLKKHGDPVDGPARDLSVAEAEALADGDEGLVYLDVPDDQYRDAAPASFQPDR
ncbi:MAG: hypothetical protein K2X87_22215 [Gemmataceae bacterium]|nr:hypothetical protein [Gemmataceae bacterium]